MAEGSVIEIQPHDQVLLVVVQKRSLDSPSAQTLVDAVLAAAAQRTEVPVVLDLSRLTFAPSVALGALVQLSKSLKLDRRRIALIGLRRRVLETILVTHLDQVLEIRDTLEQVLQAPPDAR